MERVLRKPDITEIDALFKRACLAEDGIAFYPVRHHSPACAYHLQEQIRRFQPDRILIEGPSDAAGLIPCIAEEASRPPFCIYYSYDDRLGKVSGDKGKYRAYYPFLDFSPELVAIRAAKERGIGVTFIDLPYALRLVNRSVEAQEQYSYNQDQEYEVNQYTAMLAKKAGCRSFAEFWESRWELNASQRDAAGFTRDLFALAYYMRQATPEDDPSYREDLQREAYMAWRIAEEASAGGRTLVVTGAFHVCGLLDRVSQGQRPEKPQMQPCSEQDVACYLMPYTFRELDSKSGYSAGMPFPAYYQDIWKNLQRKGKGAAEAAYETAALDYIIKTARYARRTQAVSMPDEINALQMAKMLAALRGKPCPGVYELLDGVRSTFVKGSIHDTATFELDFLLRMLTGMGAGTVGAGSGTPPVVAEFRSLCAKYRIKTGTIERQEIVLDIVKNPAHYIKSQFLHKMKFLDTGFCTLESGPDYVSGRDRNLAREIWVCRYSTQVETRLIDLSVYGASLSQVCAGRIEQGFRDSMTAQELGKLLLSVHVMGLGSFYADYSGFIRQVVEGDRNFVSLCGLLSSLRTLAGMERLMDGKVRRETSGLISSAFRSAVDLIPVVRQIGEDEEQQVCEDLKDLYALSVEAPDWCDGEAFAEQMEASLADSFSNSRFYGTCLAIRHKQGGMAIDAFCMGITSYLESSMAHPEQAASFVCGVFLAARDVIFADSAVLDRIDQVIAAMSQEDFLAVLPNLRYAFTNFLPSEIDRVGEAVAAKHNGSSVTLKGSADVTKEDVAYGMQLDSYAASELEKWGFADG